jgi:hypothetical protein
MLASICGSVGQRHRRARDAAGRARRSYPDRRGPAAAHTTRHRRGEGLPGAARLARGPDPALRRGPGGDPHRGRRDHRAARRGYRHRGRQHRPSHPGIAIQLTASDITRLLLGATLAGALWAVIGLGVGAIVRAQVPTIVGLFAWVLFVENILGDVPSWQRFAPGSLAQSLGGQVRDVALTVPITAVGSASAGPRGR